MPLKTPVPVFNRLISGLPRKTRDSVVDACEIVELVSDTVLYETNQNFKHVYFPSTGFISQAVAVSGHPPMEMGLIGNEGMLGGTILLGIDTAPLRAIVQGSGLALRMKVKQFRRALSEHPVFARTISRYLYVRMSQLAHNAVCSHFHEVEPRLARCLLLTQDIAHADDFHLTHQHLADMLGVQRSAVTIAAGGLQKRKLIDYARGDINIVDRKGLEQASCECYEKIKLQYTRLFETF